MNSHHTLVTLLILSTITLMTLTLFILHLESTFIIEWELMTVNSSFISFPMIIDPMGTFMASTVTFISFNVFIFTKTYMNKEINLTRFTHLLLLFVSSMIALIFSPNLMTLMLGWDGLGITSFLLVIYYPTNDALNSGMVTALTNRIGDCLLLGAMTLMLSQGHWNSWSLWPASMNSPTCLALLILLAAMTKSAQLPFMYWLPEAMAAPTPVSTLVHSSTLVTAGVYMIMRFYPFISSVGLLNNLLLLSSTATLLTSSIWATVEYDIKKIVALSTMSQISLMMLTLSLGLPSLAYLHLVTHAMFKSLLFLTVGIHIMMTHHQQNLMNLEADKYMPSLAIPASVSLAALNAFFFTAGYYSKDLIVETAIYIPKDVIIEQIVLTAMGTSVGSTMTYTIRLHRVLCNSTKLVKPDGVIAYPLYSLSYINDFNSSIRTPVAWLTMGSITMGSIAIWAFLTPNETPTMYLDPHMAPWFWTSMGFLTATSSCALNHKLKMVHTTPYKMKSRPIFMYRLFSSSWHALKYLLNLKPRPIKKSSLGLLPHMKQTNPEPVNLLPRLIPKHKLALYFEHIANSKGPEIGYRSNNNMMGGVKQLTYFMVPHIMKLSLKTFKIMDQGWLEFHLPHTSKTVTHFLSSKISNSESLSLTMLLFLMIMSSSMLSLLIYSLLL